MTTAIQADTDREDFPLLPRHGVMLHAPNGGGDHFARLFGETWRRLPLYARRRILALWREPNYDWGQEVRPPLIQLSTSWNGRSRGDGLKGDWGCCRGRGHTIHFWTKFVAAIPDDLVPDLIAHELAHVHQWACGWDLASGYVQTRNGHVEVDLQTIEREADDRVGFWGFSSTSLESWCIKHGVIEALEPTPENIKMIYDRIHSDGR